jgi:hypothetical protein
MKFVYNHFSIARESTAFFGYIRMIDFSLRQLTFPLNELHKRTIGIVFMQRESISLRNAN